VSWRVCIDFGTALSKAAAYPIEARNPEAVRPLSIGRSIGSPSPLLAPCAVFIGERVHFGPSALSQAAAHLEQKREAMLSFKTVLAATDLDAALKLKATRAVDPQGVFDRRSLVVLFLSWVMTLVEEAIERDLGADPRAISLRYSRPGWNPKDMTRAHQTVARMFDEARFIAGEAKGLLRDGVGLDIATALKLLELARGAELESIVEGCMLEAVAAAACRSTAGSSAMWLVLDIGAGTTDIAALQIRSNGELREIVPARKTFNLAGDALDRVLLDLFVSKARNARTLEQQSALWRRALLSVREQKEGLFASGRAALRYDGKIVTIKRSELEGDRDFKSFRQDLETAYEASLSAAVAAAEGAGVSEISVVLAGGGANLGFVQDLVRKTKPKRTRIKIVIRPLVPDWAEDAQFGGQLAPVFSQLSIALGGALAPANLIAADRIAAERAA
jgi:molecular chaperone DnaK